MPFYRFLKDLLMIYFIHTEISTCQGSSLLLGKAAAQHCNGSPPWRMETKSWKGLLFLEQSWRTFQIIFPGPPQGFFYSGSFLYVPLQSLLIKKKDLHNFYEDNTISQLPKDLDVIISISMKGYRNAITRFSEGFSPNFISKFEWI